MIDLGLIVKVTEIIFCSGLLSSIHFSLGVHTVALSHIMNCMSVNVYFGGATSVTVAVSSASWRAHVNMQECSMVSE